MPFRKFIHDQEKYFIKGGRLEKFASFYEMVSTFFYQTSEVAQGKTHLRDSLDLKRVMITVVIALIPCVIMAFFNTGYQANLVISKLTAAGAEIPFTWRETILSAVGIGFNPHSFIDNMAHGALFFLPLYTVVVIVGGFWEMLFAVLRKHVINESFLVTSLLFPLVLPPTVPLWQAAVAISFGLVIGKELFGGTGRNIVNPALFSRAFLFFAYPASMTGEAIWYGVYADGISGATPLAAAKQGLMTVDWWSAFLGLIPGSMGETSTLACLIGAFVLVWTGLGSLRIMLSAAAGLIVTTLFFNMVSDNPFMQLGPHWHLVLGGFAFGAVFMATDPVSASLTRSGKVVYGFLIGVLTMLVRFVNPAYPEGVMLAILFCNVMAPSIDYIYLKRNMKRREVRCAR